MGFYDDGILNEVILQDCYKARTQLKSGDVAIDVGANIGCFSVLAAGMVGSAGRVISFEPAPNNFEILKRNVRENKLEGICELHQLALGDSEKEIPLNILAAGNLYSVVRKGSSGRQISVMAKCLDSFKLDKVDFLKIDVEGFEYEVLKGSVLTIKKFLPKIALETHSWAVNESMIISFLSDLGYSITTLGTKESAKTLYAEPQTSGRLANYQVVKSDLNHPGQTKNL